MSAVALVVGAGPAGLAAAYELKRRGTPVRIVDGARRIGEPWRKRHPALRLNTHRRVSSLPGLPIPAYAGAYPGRDAFVGYLESYEKFLGIDIEYATNVARIDARPGGGWTASTDRGDIAAADVVVATGPDRIPVTPAWPGAAGFGGRLIHAAHLQAPASYEGARVLIVGAGNSGVDVANHLARVAVRELAISVRRTTWIVPKRAFGMPLQPLSVALRKAPRLYQDALVAMIQRATFGDLTRFGLVRPRRGALARFREDGVAAAIDDGFVAALAAGRIAVHPEIERFDGDGVRFVNGDRCAADVVVCATGYRTGLEPMVGHLNVLDASGRPNFVGGRRSQEHDGLWFVGQRSNFHGNLHARGVEARELARAVSRRRRLRIRYLPSTTRTSTVRPYTRQSTTRTSEGSPARAGSMGAT